MSVTTAPEHHATQSRSRPRTVLLARAALAVGAAWGVAFTIVALGFRLTPDDHPFRHAADYWYTGLGLPLALSGAAIIIAIHILHVGQDGRRGQWGARLFVLPMLIFSAMFIQALWQGQTSSWGPTYILCVLLSDVALAVYVFGCWRAGLLPRWLLAIWWVGWFLGGPLAQGPTPLLLTAAYVLLAAHLTRTSPRSHG